MAIYPTTTGYKIKVMRNGFTFRDFVKGINNQQRAREIEACAIADMVRGVRPRKGQIGEHGTSLTLQNLYDDAMETVWKGVSVTYAKKLGQMWKDYKAYFEDKQGIYTLDRITTLEIDGFINWLETNPTRPNCNSTVNNKLCLISKLFTRQCQLGHMQYAPIINWRPRNKNARPRFYSVWEEQQIKEQAMACPFLALDAKKRMADFFTVLFDTGMRPWMEAWNMQKSWLRYSSTGARIVRVPVEFSKTNTERDIPVGDRTLAILLRYSEGKKPTDQLFKGLAIQAHVERFWVQHLRPTLGWGHEEVPYCMRHSFATRLVENDTNLITVQQLLGHSDITQTARYSKVTDAAKEAAISTLNKSRVEAGQRAQIEDKFEAIVLLNREFQGNQVGLTG